jgi:hypothetical protein
MAVDEEVFRNGRRRPVNRLSRGLGTPPRHHARKPNGARVSYARAPPLEINRRPPDGDRQKLPRHCTNQSYGPSERKFVPPGLAGRFELTRFSRCLPLKPIAGLTAEAPASDE